VPQAGIYYYGNRFYEPNFQRFLNRDPIGEAVGINLYSFVGNNPVNWIDPYGLDYHYFPNYSLLPTPAAHYVYGDTLWEQTSSAINDFGYLLANTAVGLGQFLHWARAKPSASKMPMASYWPSAFLSRIYRIH